jgi:hypothetical protein
LVCIYNKKAVNFKSVLSIYCLFNGLFIGYIIPIPCLFIHLLS